MKLTLADKLYKSSGVLIATFFPSTFAIKLFLIASSAVLVSKLAEIISYNSEKLTKLVCFATESNSVLNLSLVNDCI